MAVAVKLAIKRVVKVKQREPTIFEIRARLADGSPAVLEVSTVAFAELVQQGRALLGQPP